MKKILSVLLAMVFVFTTVKIVFADFEKPTPEPTVTPWGNYVVIRPVANGAYGESSQIVEVYFGGYLVATQDLKGNHACDYQPRELIQLNPSERNLVVIWVDSQTKEHKASLFFRMNPKEDYYKEDFIENLPIYTYSPASGYAIFSCNK